MTWNHKVYLADGTILTDSQWNQLVKDGTIALDDGRRIELDEKDRLYAEGVLRAFRPKATD